ncbi:zinc-binding dehydrogenase [Microbacterium sp. RD1]|uniref:zinc-binding dehydrogenase n=1 Tax=Microbacterium sp. RD1 TaxID=3457313 RepID=UPI003FA56F83
MRAAQINRFGDSGGIAVVDLPRPSPGPEQVLIRTEAIGVAGVDAVIRRGTLGSYGFAAGMIPGSEVAGTVVEVGAGADASWVGKRVWAFTGRSGAYAEFALALATDITVLPADLAPAEAVTVGSAAPVAHFALRHAHFRRGESVLVRGAAGSLGIAMVELAARDGASAIAVTTSSADRGRRLRALGATHVLDRAGRSDGEVAPESYDVVLDVVGGPALPDFLDRLDVGGRMVVVGVVAGMPPADFGSRLLSAFPRSLSFSSFSLDIVPSAEKAQARAELLTAAARGELTPVVHDVLPLKDAAQAHERMDAGEVFGRIVLVP